MNDKRFTLTAGENMKWTVSDKETGFSLTFTEGMFNETQEVEKPKTLPDGVGDHNLVSWAAHAMSSIGDYMALNHGDLVNCDIEARRMAIWMLSNEKYWITLAAACNGLLIDFNFMAADELLSEIDDYLCLTNENPADLTDAERINLTGSLSMMDDDMAQEVFRMLSAFWNYHHEHNVSVERWASEVLWWPAWANCVESEDDTEEYDEE